MADFELNYEDYEAMLVFESIFVLIIITCFYYVLFTKINAFWFLVNIFVIVPTIMGFIIFNLWLYDNLSA